jgi:hypothetical protein
MFEYAEQPGVNMNVIINSAECIVLPAFVILQKLAEFRDPINY